MFAIAFGCIEGSVVVYLREIDIREASLHSGTAAVLNLPRWRGWRAVVFA